MSRRETERERRVRKNAENTYESRKAVLHKARERRNSQRSSLISVQQNSSSLLHRGPPFIVRWCCLVEGRRTDTFWAHAHLCHTRHESSSYSTKNSQGNKLPHGNYSRHGDLLTMNLFRFVGPLMSCFFSRVRLQSGTVHSSRVQFWSGTVHQSRSCEV